MCPGSAVGFQGLLCSEERSSYTLRDCPLDSPAPVWHDWALQVARIEEVLASEHTVQLSEAAFLLACCDLTTHTSACSCCHRGLQW